MDSDNGPSSSSVSTATPPNGRNGRLLTPTSDDGEYVEYSFDSLSDMPYTEEDEDRVSYTLTSFRFFTMSSCCTTFCCFQDTLVDGSTCIKTLCITEKKDLVLENGCVGLLGDVELIRPNIFNY